jgi:transcriptional regulator with XRE-family HTH domain
VKKKTEKPADTTGARIRALRLEQKLTQEALAALAGVRQSHLSVMEGGKRAPIAETLARLADALGVTADSLIVREGMSR